MVTRRCGAPRPQAFVPAPEGRRLPVLRRIHTSLQSSPSVLGISTSISREGLSLRSLAASAYAPACPAKLLSLSPKTTTFLTPSGTFVKF